MRVALLAYHYIQAAHLFGIQDCLIKNGHEATIFYKEGFSVRPNSEWINWEDFDFSRIKDYDRLYIFNGYASETFLQTVELKRHFKDRMFFVEKGWLPQKDSIYIDKDGLGGRSSLAKENLAAQTKSAKIESKKREVFNELKSFYSNDFKYDMSNYILVPMQLDWDTSITLDSPQIKTCRSLINFVATNFRDQGIVVRPHPLLKNFIKPIYTNVYYEETAKTVDLAKYASCVIGINSTVMIESLVHMKPVMFLGNGVLDSTIGTHLKYDGTNLNKILSFTPNSQSITRALATLKVTQFDMNNVTLSDLCL